MLSIDHPHRVQEDDKFHSRLFSKETFVAIPSFRVYYGVAPGAVPFLWELQPGTPKHASSDTPLPPLTPPPAYFSSPARSRCPKKPSKSSLIIDTILPKLSLRKSTSASTTYSLASSPAASSVSTFPRRPASPMSSYSSSRDEEEESDSVDSPTSTLCFRGRRGRAGGLKWRHSVIPMKCALLSIVHGHHGS